MDTTRDVPKTGEIRRTAFPDGFDGIRFGIGRMIKYVQEFRKDPLIVSAAKRIVDDYSVRPGHESDKDPITVRYLKAIHAWGREVFIEVPDPPNIEVIETPKRLIRRWMVRPEAEAFLYEPFIHKAGSNLILPKPKITTNLVSSITLVLSLIGSFGIRPLRIRFGGSDGTLHYAWSSVQVYGEWFDVDLLQAFAKKRDFEHVEDLEIPLA